MTHEPALQDRLHAPTKNRAGPAPRHAAFSCQASPPGQFVERDHASQYAGHEHLDEVDRSHDAERIHAGAYVRGLLRGRRGPRELPDPKPRSVGAAAGRG